MVRMNGACCGAPGIAAVRVRNQGVQQAVFGARTAVASVVVVIVRSSAVFGSESRITARRSTALTWSQIRTLFSTSGLDASITRSLPVSTTDSSSAIGQFLLRRVLWNKPSFQRKSWKKLFISSFTVLSYFHNASQWKLHLLQCDGHTAVV